ncbi:RDD family protein [Nocardioides sp. BP30]|uniref:RDD family protein n=1 Tax=Nocardioides sp. BP30 TaxID=3036374 RepID=UPI0024697B11|nr:RDD family protein [Nocardioides sp. BP30]WGL53672.1 RDD family protein [Nocardioides sp. BP30]
MSEAPAGWYPDPAASPGLPDLRYWDGLRWTEHVHRYDAVAPTYRPTTPDGEPLAGWWHRVGASAIDGIFGAIVAVVVTLPGQVAMQRDQRSLNEEFTRRVDAGEPGALSWYLRHLVHLYGDHAWLYLAAAVILVLVHTVFLRLWGGTPGQLVTGLRTRLRSRPGPLSWGRALVRVLVYSGLLAILEELALLSGSLTAVGVVLLVGGVWTALNPLWAAWDGKKQALHDKIVGSNVVRTRP